MSFLRFSQRPRPLVAKAVQGNLVTARDQLGDLFGIPLHRHRRDEEAGRNPFLAQDIQDARKTSTGAVFCGGEYLRTDDAATLPRRLVVEVEGNRHREFRPARPPPREERATSAHTPRWWWAETFSESIRSDGGNQSLSPCPPELMAFTRIFGIKVLCSPYLVKSAFKTPLFSRPTIATCTALVSFVCECNRPAPTYSAV